MEMPKTKPTKAVSSKPRQTLANQILDLNYEVQKVHSECQGQLQDHFKSIDGICQLGLNKLPKSYLNMTMKEIDMMEKENLEAAAKKTSKMQTQEAKDKPKPNKKADTKGLSEKLVLPMKLRDLPTRRFNSAPTTKRLEAKVKRDTKENRAFAVISSTTGKEYKPTFLNSPSRSGAAVKKESSSSSVFFTGPQGSMIPLDRDAIQSLDADSRDGLKEYLNAIFEI